ncbi:DUF4434 domain-containing protein [Anaerobacterium chartisolvens]|nr:DUF4434 domain-containing protein [Anaerobacterium chartisolvens]
MMASGAFCTTTVKSAKGVSASSGSGLGAESQNSNMSNANPALSSTTVFRQAQQTPSKLVSVSSTEPVINGGIALSRKPIASFIQSWAVRDWTQTRWEQELSAMKASGFQFVIIQSVVDVGYSTDADWSKYEEDYSQYELTSVDSLYPSQIPLLANGNNGTDSLGNCFEAAVNTGMKVMLGPLDDNRWWLYGWDQPQASAGVTDLVKESYFGKWVAENADLNNQVAREIWQKYGAVYDQVFYGWYYYNELWNMPMACTGEDNGVLTEILADSFNSELECYSDITPGKPFLFSPFCNFSLTTTSQYEKMWKDLFTLVNFRDGDIFCPQDSIGGNPDQITNLDEWTAHYKAAADSKPGLQFWSNNENFTSDGGTALLNRYFSQVKITSKYAAQNIVFSWNHYINPLLANANEGYNDTYLDFVKNGKLDDIAPAAPKLTKSGKIITVYKPSDNIGVAGFNIYTSNGSLYRTVYLDANAGSARVKVSAKGTYYVRSFDFAYNLSAQSSVAVS